MTINLGLPFSLTLVGVSELWLAVAVVASLAKLLTLVSLLMGVEAARPLDIASASVSCRWPLAGPAGGFSSTGTMYDSIATGGSAKVGWRSSGEGNAALCTRSWFARADCDYAKIWNN